MGHAKEVTMTGLPLYPTDDGWPYPDYVDTGFFSDGADVDLLALSGVIGMLHPIQRSIVSHRFGLNGDRRLSLNEIAHVIGCSQAEISALLAQALYRLRIALSPV